MLNYKECENILNAKGKKYNEQQVKEINEFISLMAELIVRNDLHKQTIK